MVGRKNEQRELRDALSRDEAQLIAVYGRRRVGKTYLVRETFKDRFYFQHSGLARGTMAEQLAAFRASLVRAGFQDAPLLRNWREAFGALESFIVAGEQENLGALREKLKATMESVQLKKVVDGGEGVGDALQAIDDSMNALQETSVIPEPSALETIMAPDAKAKDASDFEALLKE